MNKRLVILSDLWGIEKSEWLVNYTRILETTFDIVYYDSCELGEVDKSVYTQDNLHKQFVQKGIEKAVEKLIELEKNPVYILAFSIGGTIAWRFGIKSHSITSLNCVSSTRLRYETKVPSGNISLYFGKNDAFKPTTVWLDDMATNYQIVPDKDHLMYNEPEFAKQLSQKIIRSYQTSEAS